MIIYFGATVTVTADGQTWRAEQCEHCGETFYYPVRFVTTGTAVNPYFLDSSSSQRAEADALNRLDSALRHEVYPVPCPHCTRYQGYMLPAVRAYQFRRLRTAGWWVLLGLTQALIFLGCLTPVLVKNTTGQHPSAALVAAVMFGLPALSLCLGIGLLWAWNRKQARFDPNAAEYTESRRQAAAALTRKPEEFARLQIPPPPLDPSPRRLGQLVNQNCVRCGQRISNELDSRFCHACKSPVHNCCAVPTEGGGCKVCGAPAT